jgi:hypothetical protein
MSRRVEAYVRVAYEIIALLLGGIIILTTLNDVFQTAIVPRAVGRRLRMSYYVWRGAWNVWPSLAWNVAGGDAERREDLLALFAPAMLMLLPIMWGLFLIVGFGTIFWSLRYGLSPRGGNFGDTAYFAGTSLTTLGFGDIVGRSGIARFVSIVAASTGLGLFSIITAYLFSLFGSFQARETFVVMLGARTGVPPSGVDLLTIAGHGGTRSNLPTLMIEAQRWIAQVMESHLAYPVLAYFRSSHDYQSWIGTLGTLLDSATLVMTTIEAVDDGQARVLYDLGRHATHDLAGHLGVEWKGTAPGLEQPEFERACTHLRDAGYRIDDAEAAWSRFSSLRGAYAPQLDALARFFAIPPLQWIGDRSPLSRPH